MTFKGLIEAQLPTAAPLRLLPTGRKRIGVVLDPFVGPPGGTTRAIAYGWNGQRPIHDDRLMIGSASSWTASSQNGQRGPWVADEGKVYPLAPTPGTVHGDEDRDAAPSQDDLQRGAEPSAWLPGRYVGQ